MIAFNPYAPVMRDETNGCYIFYEPAGQNNEGRTLSVEAKKETETTLQRLLCKEPVEYAEVLELFGDETTKQMMQYGILIEAPQQNEDIYARSKAFYAQYGFENAQERLRSRNVLILGCGGIGTHIAWQMAVLGVGKLTLLDHDRIEVSNLNRQILFDHFDIGKSKVQTLKDKINAINPSVEIVAVEERIISKAQLESICTAQSYDLIVKALDSPTKLPLWLDEICRTHNLPYVAGLTLRDRAMIGPTFLPGKSKIGYSDLIDVQSYGDKVFGTVSSLGIILNEIASELAIEAFKVLLKQNNLKYLDKIEIKDLFHNTSDFIVNKKRLLFSVFQKTNLKTVLDILIIGLSVGYQFLNPWFYLLVFFLCIAIPNIVFETKSSILKGTAVNIMLVTIFNIARVLPAVLANQASASGFLLLFQLLMMLIGMSILLLVGVALSSLICKITKKY